VITLGGGPVGAGVPEEEGTGVSEGDAVGVAVGVVVVGVVVGDGVTTATSEPDGLGVGPG
jgi:hypothetical protein